MDITKDNESYIFRLKGSNSILREKNFSPKTFLKFGGKSTVRQRVKYTVSMT